MVEPRRQHAAKVTMVTVVEDEGIVQQFLILQKGAEDTLA